MSEEKRTRAEIEAEWAPVFAQRVADRASMHRGRTDDFAAYVDAYLDRWYRRELDQAVDRLPKWDGE